MVTQNLALPHRLVCFADDPQGITECETFPLWAAPQVTQKRTQNSYRRLRLFDPDFAAQFGERIVQMDLDCVVLRDLTSLFARPDPFVAVRGVSAPINGSMWMLRVGWFRNVWDRFDPLRSPREIENALHKGKRLVGSDQAWMSLRIPNPATWGPEDGVHQFSQWTQDAHSSARIVFYAGATKPWDLACAAKAPTLFNTYRAYS